MIHGTWQANMDKNQYFLILENDFLILDFFSMLEIRFLILENGWYFLIVEIGWYFLMLTNYFCYVRNSFLYYKIIF